MMATHRPSSLRRLIAFIIDRMILMVALAPWLLMATDTEAGEMHLSWPLIALVVLTPFLYRVAFWMFRGQTPGKMVTSLVVVSADANPRLHLSQACIRSLCDFFQLFFSFGFAAVALFRDDRRQLSDLLAGTRVLQISPSREPQGARLALAMFVIAVSLFNSIRQYKALHQLVSVTSRGMVVQLPQGNLHLPHKRPPVWRWFF